MLMNLFFSSVSQVDDHIILSNNKRLIKSEITNFHSQYEVTDEPLKQ